MKWNRMKELAAQGLEIPLEVALNTIKISLIGNREVKAVNHRGILIYETARILFQTVDGPVEVTGSGMTLVGLNEEYLHIMGRIHAIRLPEHRDET